MKLILVALLIFLAVSSVFSQDKKDAPVKEKKSLVDKVSELPDILIAQKEKVDTNAHRFVQDILSIEVPPLWKEKGTMLFNDLKLSKTDKEPLNVTLPLPDKKLIQGVNITLNSIKKSPEERKNMAVAQVKKSISTILKEQGITVGAKELDVVAQNMFTGPESFTTRQGKTGQLYMFHDIQTQQTSYVILFMIPGDTPNSVHFAQFQYYRYIYETSPPEDILEWRTFVYPDDQQTFVDFTKGILKTFTIR